MKRTHAAHQYATHTYAGVNGAKMTYYLFVPDSYTPQRQYPLILLLHGVSECADTKSTPAQNRARLLNQYYAQVWISSAVQDTWPAFIVLPQVVAPDRWVDAPSHNGSYTLAPQPGTSLMLAKEIVERVQQEYQGIDPQRRYVTGLSMGAFGTWEMVERWPSYFAAAAPLAGAGDPSKAAELVHLPIWAFHGGKDTTVPISGTEDMIRAIVQAGGHPLFSEYSDDGHDLWKPGKVYSPDANPAFFTWLFTQKR